MTNEIGQQNQTLRRKRNRAELEAQIAADVADLRQAAAEDDPGVPVQRLRQHVAAADEREVPAGYEGDRHRGAADTARPRRRGHRIV